jgi:hypothetical protein
MCSVIECGQRPQDGGAGLVVVPDRGGHREDALGDTHGDALEGATAVLFQVQLALEGVVDRLDQLSHRLQQGLALAAFLPFEGQPEQLDALEGEIGLELLGGETLVRDDQQAGPVCDQVRLAPKSRAGRRTVAFPAELVPELRWHLERFAEPGERGHVFIGPKGGRLRRSNFRDIWIKARTSVGLPDFHFHDLRHTGGTLSAATGASLKELMARLGHSSVRAAMMYQHATRDRDKAIAVALGGLIRLAAETKDQGGGRSERDA